MHIAVILGSGPEVDHLLNNQQLFPPNSKAYFSNTSEHAKNNHLPFEVIDVFDWKKCSETLAGAGISYVVLVGSLQPRNPRLSGKDSYRLYTWVSFRLLMGQDISDVIRHRVARRYRDQLTFPPLKQFIPELFADHDVRVNPDDTVLATALRNRGSYRRDATLRIRGELVRVLRVSNGATDLINRRLMPGRLEAAHASERITRFFFQRERTVVFDLNALEAYARTKNLTLQSF